LSTWRLFTIGRASFVAGLRELDRVRGRVEFRKEFGGEDVSHLSPLRSEHMNLHGTHLFDLGS
jgi:hypothetical protein